MGIHWIVVPLFDGSFKDSAQGYGASKLAGLARTLAACTVLNWIEAIRSPYRATPLHGIDQ